MVARLAAAAALLLAACAARLSVRPDPEGAKTTFRYRGSAEEVLLLGDMTGWRPVPFARDGGTFGLTIDLPPGRYEYRVQVRESTAVRVVLPEGAERAEDGYGGENAVLRVAGP